MRTTSRWLCVCAGVAILGCVSLFSSSRADEPKDKKESKEPIPQPGPVKNLDKAIHANLREIINHGAELFNKQGDHYGCYRVWDGSLRTLRPMLEHYPALQKAIDEGLANAAKLPRASDRAFELRKVIDNIRDTLVPPEKVDPKDKNKEDPKKVIAKGSLWDRLGGETVLTQVIEDFMKAAADDSRINVTRGGKYKLDDDAKKALKKKFLDFLSSVTGGPHKYTGKSMKEVHKGMGITNYEFDAAANQFVRAMSKNGVKAAPGAELVKAMGALRADIVELPPNHAWLSGKVLWDGKSGPAGYLTLINKDKVKVSTFMHKDGAYSFKNPIAAGEYTVILEEGLKGDPLTENNPFPIPPQFTDPATSPLRIEITPGTQVHDLRLTKKG
jgi:hemoglobin